MAPIQRFGSLRNIRRKSSSTNANANAISNNINTNTNSNSNSNTNTNTPQDTVTHEGLIAMRYEDMFPGARAPIPVTVAPPLSPPSETHPAFRPRLLAHEVEGLKDDAKRDSGLAPTTSTITRDREAEGEGEADGADLLNTVDNDNVLGININFDSKVAMANSSPTLQTQWGDVQSPALAKSPTLMKNECVGSSSAGSLKRWKTKNGNAKTSPERGAGAGHGTDINRQPSFSMLATTSPTIKVLSDDLEMESQKVRSMYESGSGFDWRDGKDDATDNRLTVGGESIPERPVTANSYLTPNGIGVPPRSASALSNRRPAELAGGIEDWEDVNGNDVDRYGFINQRTTSRPGTPEPKPPQRVSTVLHLASQAPRRKRTFGRSPSTANSQRGLKRTPSRKVSARSSKRSQGDNASIRSSRSSQLRQAANRLPGNKDRRWMDEAGDMLTLPPGLADIAEEVEGGKGMELMKRKESERTEKWRRMAKIIKGKDGEGMEFEFDTKSSKLIERTWKGIPDRWRSAAWYSFLASSAKKRKGSPQEEDIIQAFHRLQDQSSADDVQIDLDVPRTINSHIMFRRRYRGGQRLLFRVLHALSLYFPATGYVQGMASLAATLLCYYDEEKCFVMLVRMWTLRGLEKLYEPGFPGLMAALDEFSTKWLDNGEVSAKLNELGIEPTAYGTRWYLTLFNYSIPFPAQLRVWDVFMLLGDEDESLPYCKDRPFAGGLDIVHATSAALIDGTRDILLDSDFESSMKVLTSWIPVKDEELLMKVAKAEWKLHRVKRRS
ncbi:hypothetical protein SS1G_05701 [Sclerotinia sclerotiorum 1980 UF-70]|uniref:Rab-GAP TBC domain-containing protein n=1 Tax=Sclerotinia sclerotiorum (strain ATCC 18683 / 1980 / Ss-1) TaxID=665079 RepID=A7EK55_SCLS1|nr:hypothetical protein SS1G_05701 [Sclerotinia sclerotiorum 1980 UF-70]EDO03221.1 hypothetical protein SS1G_05701 [Sclerotinia sclerotiorum 1980 UF-70]